MATTLQLEGKEGQQQERSGIEEYYGNDNQHTCALQQEYMIMHVCFSHVVQRQENGVQATLGKQSPEE